MKHALIPVLLAVAAGSALAQHSSPDGRYVIEYFGTQPHEANVRFKDAETGKILYTGTSSGYESEEYHELKWSSDSRYLAVVARGAKTTSDIELYRFDKDLVQQVPIPDYRLNLLGRRNLVTGGRHHWVSDLRWDTTRITFHCFGQWIDGSGDPAIDPDNWYHFDVSIDLLTAKPTLAAVTEAHSTKGEQNAAPNP
jgi:dipeptidyl aminopeptidase/acylaminoacyl peptidase